MNPLRLKQSLIFLASKNIPGYIKQVYCWVATEELDKLQGKESGKTDRGLGNAKTENRF